MCDILVLDDDPLVLMTTVESLCDAGFDVSGMLTSDAAMVAVRHRSPRIIVTDVHLGHGKDGRDFVRQVRLNHPTMPVIYITGRPDVMRDRPVTSYDHVMPKPFWPTNLVEKVRSLLAA